ncbi:MAG TPA: hypothetical protein VGS79_07820 [Puia sp.]|nr:hypothetical protein [Puia sp.]
MIRFLFVFLLFVSNLAVSQALPVMLKGQIFATIVQGKIDKNVRWDIPKAAGQQGYLSFEFLYPRNIVRDSQEIDYHLDMEHRLFVSFFNAKELLGLRAYEVAFPISGGHGADTYDMRLDPNFRDLEESPFLRLERLTRAIPYFAWSNYLSTSHSDRGTVIVNLKDMDQWTSELGREDFCNVLAFAVYYYAFKQQLAKPLLIIYRGPGDVLERYAYPVGTDFRKYLNVFNNQ